MLNKEICKKCIKEIRFLPWNEEDDIEWKCEIINCPMDGAIIFDEPKERCRYLLEQTVMSQDAE